MRAKSTSPAVEQRSGIMLPSMSGKWMSGWISQVLTPDQVIISTNDMITMQKSRLLREGSQVFKQGAAEQNSYICFESFFSLGAHTLRDGSIRRQSDRNIEIV